MSKNVMVDSVPEFTKERSRAIGAILVELGRLSPDDVERIQDYASKHSVRFGDAALALQLLTEDDINLAIGRQFKYPILRRGGDSGVGDEVIAAYQPQSQTVEALRLLRSQLTLRWIGSAERKTMVILSPDRGDGRSWLAANLATVFAQMGERVLLIDADMRHPRQHQLFNLNNSVGLSALLTGRAGKEVVTRDAAARQARPPRARAGTRDRAAGLDRTVHRRRTRRGGAAPGAREGRPGSDARAVPDQRSALARATAESAANGTLIKDRARTGQ